MKGWTIRQKMTFWYMLTIICLLCAFFALLYGTLTPAIVRGVQERIEQDAVSIGPSVADADGKLKMDDVVISVDTLYTVYTPDGVPAFANHELTWFTDTPFVENATHQVHASGQDWVLHDGAINRDGTLTAFVRTGAPLGSYANTASALLLIFLIAIPAGAAAALFIGRQIAKRSLQPIDEITRTAEEIRQGDLTRRISLPETQDEVGHLASAFNEMLDSLETAFTREKQFTSDASHELRTPLAVIIGAAQTSLGERTLPISEYKAALRTIYKRGVDMQTMLSQMLLLARGHEQTKLMEITTINMSDLVRDIAEEFIDMAAKKQIEIHLDIQEMVFIEGDLMLMTRAVMNLIDNGIKYGKQHGWLLIILRGPDGRAVLVVQDNGHGIRAQDIPHIFDRFYRGDASRSSAGNGLGLSLTERIIELHKGSISVQSNVDEGSIFRVELPLKEAD